MSVEAVSRSVSFFNTGRLISLYRSWVTTTRSKHCSGAAGIDESEETAVRTFSVAVNAALFWARHAGKGRIPELRGLIIAIR